MRGRDTALAGAGLAAGGVVLAAVAALLHRTLQPVLETARYAQDIRAAADGVAGNLDAGGELARLGEAARRLKSLAAPEQEDSS